MSQNMGQPLTHILTHNRLSRSGFCTTKQHPATLKSEKGVSIFPFLNAPNLRHKTKTQGIARIAPSRRCLFLFYSFY